MQNILQRDIVLNYYLFSGRDFFKYTEDFSPLLCPWKGKNWVYFGKLHS